MQNILFLDIESDPKTRKVSEVGVIFGNREYKGADMMKILPWIGEAKYICGHNIIGHDIPLLEEKLGSLFNNKKFIDTLVWSPLLFADKPYHSIQKNYKGFTHRDEPNNSFLDSKIVIEWLHDFIQRFDSLEEDWKRILHGLLHNDFRFHGFLEYIGIDYSVTSILEQILTTFEGKICKNAQVTELILHDPVELAYALSLIQATDASILAKWVSLNFPETKNVLNKLRFTECENSDCHFCASKLNPKKALENYFGYSDFRFFSGDGETSLQEKAVRAELKNESFLTVFPTGGGKSLTFQLPALMRGDLKRELTVVISPLVSLMKDQVDVLEARHNNVRAVFVSGLLSTLEREEVLERVENGGAHILYVSPESLRSNTMLRLLKSRNIARFVIDEAHCFSSWGQDFRVDYLFIGDFIKELQIGKMPIPVSCFTATAKPQVIEDIKTYFKKRLNLDLKEYVTRAERVNLKYQVIKVEHQDEKIGELMRLLRTENTPAIIYSSRVKTVISIAAILQKNGINCTYFHGKLEKEQKVKHQNEFMKDEVDVIVATSAFGMGVDKSDVKTVIHFDISDSLENYIQEAGRAGRDENINAKCFILYNEEDLNKHFALLQNTKLNQKEIGQIWRAIKNHTQFRDKISQSALELAKSAGWETDIRDLQNRITTCLAALEDRGFIKRGQNNIKLYANSLSIKNYDKTIEIINAAPGLTNKQKETCSRVVQRLIKENECQVDYLADILSLTVLELEETIQLLREISVLGDQKDLTAYIDVQSSSKNSAGILDKAIKIETLLINILPECKHRFGIRELNQKIIDSGIQNAETSDLFNLLNWWEKKSFITKSRIDREKQIFTIKFKVQIDEIKKDFDSRKALAVDCLRYLEKFFEIQKNEKQKIEFPVEFSIFGIKREINKSSLFSKSYSQKEIETALLFLNHIKSIKLEGGFMIYYKRYNIEKIDKNSHSQFNKDDYRKMEEFYANKVQQIHIVGDYAKKCIDNYASAIKFVNDYFSQNYKDFITEYFPDRTIELGRPMTESRFRKLFENLDTWQLNIVKDNTDKILIAAGPGSGKTEVLVRKIASLLTIEDIKPEQFLMLTYSKSAAIEFKSRVNQIIPELGRFIKISTFHGFCFEILGQLGDLVKADKIIEHAIKSIKNEDVDISSIANKSVLLLDEFQDVNSLEWDLISTIREISEKIRIIAVGDDDQNIFEFRRADIKFMKQFMNEIDTIRYDLLVNYRSKDNIVEFNNEFVLQINNRIKSGSVLTSSPENKDNGIIRIVEYRSNNLIKPICDDVASNLLPGTTAILTRTNEQALLTANYLISMGLKVKLVAGFEGFDLKNLLEFRYFTELLDRKKISGGIVTSENLESAKKEFENYFQNNPLGESCNSVIQMFIDKFGPRYTLLDWSQYIHSIKMEDALKPQESIIYVSTMHKSKGKQFDHVYVLLDNYEIKKEEDIRLLYVATTRAKFSLVIHENRGIYKNISSEIELIREQDLNQYSAPEDIELILTHKDVQLGGFNYINTSRKIDLLKTGDALVYGEVKFNTGIARGLNAITGENIILFSIDFIKKLEMFETKGYTISGAHVEYIVYWYNEKLLKEYKIVLPRISLKRKKI